MTRFALALGALVFFGAPRVALAAPLPPDEIARLVAAITNAPSVTVEHVVREARPVRFFSKKPSERLVEVGRFRRELGADWVASFAVALEIARLDSASRASLPICLGDPKRRDRITLTFGTGKDAIVVTPSFTELNAAIGRMGAPGVGVPIEQQVGQLRTLIGRALPDDSLLATIPPCFPATVDSLFAAREPSTTVNLLIEELPDQNQTVRPIYPRAAQRAGITGTVLLEVLVLENGRVGATRVLESIPELDEEAVRAVEEWRYKPARRGGKPVPVWVVVPVTFRLN